MAHIVSCMASASPPQDYIGLHIAAQMSTDTLTAYSSVGEERKSYVWRMQQPDSRKYQLFPTVPPERQIITEPSQSSNPMAEKTEKQSLASGLRSRIKEHNLNRRRKVSVPELGPMTTVQEVAMDSPTIPGRPALHERSNSSPVNAPRHRPVGETRSITTGPSNGIPRSVPAPSESRTPLSPKDLTPLVIPIQGATLPTVNQLISPPARARAGTTPYDHMARSSTTLYTPMTASTVSHTPRSAITNSTMPTPISAPADARSSPEPWGDRRGGPGTTSSEKPSQDSPMTFSKIKVDTVPRSASALSFHTRSGSVSVVYHGPRSGSVAGHRRNQSDTGSIMERGRPRKRVDGTLITGKSHKRSISRQSYSDERRAFEELPQGWKPLSVPQQLDSSEVDYLQKQAEEQVMRFDVLRKEDVERLSQELRRLDERTDYLRKTYTSLRAGRRNLHSRICQYLRSSRGASFSQEALLKQEEALAELDASIDDWVSKLECAENRRTRVRQKLLEHVAAAVTLTPRPSQNDGRSYDKFSQVVGPNVQPACTSDLSTPPRSPSKDTFLKVETSPSPSPQRVVARVPSVIHEESDTLSIGRLSTATISQCALERMESIRIYADSDVYELLADVESEFTKLNNTGLVSPELAQSHCLTEKSKGIHRAHSYELLGGSAKPSLSSPPPLDSRPESRRSDRISADDNSIFLTSAVFQPVRAPVRAQTPNF